MGLWKITDSGPSEIPTTKLKQEKLLEEHLEDWIMAQPEILGEPLLIVGRQVRIPDTKDRLDLLAIDPTGAAVIIELKRGHLRDPVDIQALRYASYISKWSFDDFEDVAKNHLGPTSGEDEFNFNALLEEFFDAEGEEIPDLNEDQRIVIVGSAVRQKLGSVALWLREHRIDIKLVEIRAYKHGEDVLIEPSFIVPLPVNRFADVGRRGPEVNPWVSDGKTWHLEKRCSTETKERLLALDAVLDRTFELDGPRWNQKLYVAYRTGNFNWLAVVTGAKVLRVNIHTKPGTFTTEQLVEELGLVEFDRSEGLADKFGLPSSVFVKARNESMDRITLRIKDDFDIDDIEFLQFLKHAYAARPKS